MPHWHTKKPQTALSLRTEPQTIHFLCTKVFNSVLLVESCGSSIPMKHLMHDSCVEIGKLRLWVSGECVCVCVWSGFGLFWRNDLALYDQQFKLKEEDTQNGEIMAKLVINVWVVLPAAP